MIENKTINHSQNHQPETRALDPNVVQRRASSPETSVWVSASAGTGKTKVLTDRVLRLLLPKANGEEGTQPQKILGITFTKAAASEMSLRITDKLAQWAITPLEQLEKDLSKLLNKKPTSKDIKAARELFARVIDTPGGLKIMTIHAFCQSLLSRFPLEAEIAPYFSVLEEAQAQEILKQAQKNILVQAQAEKASQLQKSFLEIASTLNKQQFFELMQNVVTERRQFREILNKNFGTDGAHNALCKLLKIGPEQTAEDAIRQACLDQNFDKKGLKEVCTALAGSDKKTDLDKLEKLSKWLESTDEYRAKTIQQYISAYLTDKGTPRKTQVTKGITKKNPALIDIIQIETDRLMALQDHLRSIDCAHVTKNILYLGDHILTEYTKLKEEQAFLDFDDLILKTRTLLTQNIFKSTSASWVLYKMDQGLEHILIDEAQDTNPDQWSIIEALCHEFFAGKGATDRKRTVFVVGDEKQSIYSFQRASPEEFTRMRKDFETKITSARENWAQVDLDISFRSTQSILKAVDTVFADPALRKGLSIRDIQHHAYRYGDAGHVEIWPVFESTKQEDIDLWSPPTDVVSAPSGQSLLADHIADTISCWIEEKEILASKNRPIKAGDIMILVRTRGALVNKISRALKARNIPVSGNDRMVLNEELVIEDLMALAQFSTLPHDDLTLACVLKTPLINLSETDLFKIAYKRKGTLWDALKNSQHSQITSYLSELIHSAEMMPPFEFFNAVIHTPCPADEISGIRAIRKRLGNETVDSINELLSSALEFERSHAPSLQAFLTWQSNREDEIKRELSENEGQVRIMTVHGAKGLQAPIVIMPDTMRTTTSPPGQIDKRLIWPEKSNLKIPICSLPKDSDPTLFSQQMKILDERLDEEYRRLLYVAMTRAEDRLYVGGYKGHRTPLENSWYYFIKKGLSRLDGVQKQDESLILSNPQTSEIEQNNEKERQTSRYKKLPDYLHKKAKNEKALSAPLTPSRPSEPEQAVTSPLAGKNIYRFRRGNITHKLLELLPQLPEDIRKKSAKAFLEKFSQDLPQNIQDEILTETLKILKNPEFSKIFTEKSRAEVSISALLEDGRLINGQIDRLLVTNDEIYIVDYKTNRPPPKTSSEIPEIYKNQMNAYADTLRQIYPKREVKAALLWTDGPYLMPVETK